MTAVMPKYNKGISAADAKILKAKFGTIKKISYLYSENKTTLGQWKFFNFEQCYVESDRKQKDQIW